MAQRKLGSLKATDVVLITAASLTADVSGVLPVANGGNGTGSYTDGQILIGQTTGNTLAKAALSGVISMDKNGLTAFTPALNGGGSLLYANTTIPAGNTVANTTSELAFTSAYSLAANTLHAGDVITVDLMGLYSAGAVVPTLTIKVKWGSTLMASTGAITVANVTNDLWTARVKFAVQSIGASGAIEAQGNAMISTTASAELGVGMTNTAAITIDTTSIQNITATATWSAANASNTITLRIMAVNQDTTQAAAGTVTNVSCPDASLLVNSGSSTPAVSLNTFGASVRDPALADLAPIYSQSGSINGSSTLSKLLGQGDDSCCDGRLTLTTGIAVTNTNVTGATTIYFTPYVGDRITIYDGTRLRMYSFTEISLALGTLVNAQAYDVFIYDNSGTITLEFAEWKNATVTMTQATPCVVTWSGHGMVTGNSFTLTTSGALYTGLTANTQYFVTKIDANSFKLSTSLVNLDAGTFIATTGSQSGTQTGHHPQARQTQLVQQNGAQYKTGALTRRYLGTFCTTTTTTTEDSTSNRYLWNNCNRLERPLSVTDSTTNWTYTTATWRQVRATSTNGVNFVTGIVEDNVSAEALAVAVNGTGAWIAPGIGVNVTSANSAQIRGAGSGSTSMTLGAFYRGYPGLGFNTLNWLEISQAVGTTTWYGQNSSAIQQSGLVAIVRG